MHSTDFTNAAPSTRTTRNSSALGSPSATWAKRGNRLVLTWRTP